jgi:predicted nucleic acid-binding protein
LSVVVDANLLVALALNDPRAPVVDRHLSRAVVAGHLERDRVGSAWERITRVGVQLHPLVHGTAAVEMALRLERSNAYDAAYVVLAQTLDAELWTLDGPLARNATALGLPVRLITAERA